MRRRSSAQLMRIACLLLAAGGALGCGRRSAVQQPLPKWEFGFWFWNGSSAKVRAGAGPVDVLFFQAGTIRHHRYLGPREPWKVHGNLPAELPPAREYWLVFRADDHVIPGLQSAPILARVAGELQSEARRRGLNVAGIQLDIDSQTRALPEYAAYLREVRKSLPADVRISITALLDWFRPGTAIADVVKAVDEFVPQFYDLQNPGIGHRPAIAARIDAAKWGPVFNRHGTRFRIGVSTFGRSRLVPAEPRPAGFVYYPDLKPLDIALNPAFTLETSRTEAKEQVLRYRASRKTRIGYTDFDPGAVFEFVLSTPEAIRAAVEQVRLMGEYCAGVVFFRWPSFNESMTAEPDEVLASAGASPRPGKPVALRVVDERCALVHCADLYLTNTPAPQAAALRYVVDTSTEMEYFLPDDKTPARMTAPGRLEVTLPPWCGRTQLHLGRAVTARPAQYTLKAMP